MMLNNPVASFYLFFKGFLLKICQGITETQREYKKNPSDPMNGRIKKLSIY